MLLPSLFAEEGTQVAINYVNDEVGARETARAVEQHGVRSFVIRADVAEEKEVVHMVWATIDALGGIDILVNNAAIQTNHPSHELASSDFDRVVAVNLRGVFLCAREVIKHFLDRTKPGVIVNMSSAHQIIPKPGFLGYAASKAGLRNLTQTLALEYAGRRIRVNNVAPSAILTRMNKAWVEDPAKRAAIESHIPIGFAATPEQIAPSVCFLASDEASYITGTTLFVDGGATLYPEYRFNWSSP